MRLTPSRLRYLEHVSRQDQAALFAEHARSRLHMLDTLEYYGMIVQDWNKPTGRAITLAGKQLLAEGGNRENAKSPAALETT